MKINWKQVMLHVVKFVELSFPDFTRHFFVL